MSYVWFKSKMRLKNYINEKAFVVNMSEINDILYILEMYREKIDKIKNIDTFLDLVNKTIKEGTNKGIIFKTKNSDSSEITGNINGDTYEITIYVSKSYFDKFKDDKIWRLFMNGVIGSLKHEITHGMQLLKVSDDYWKYNSQPFKVKNMDDINQRKKNISHPHEVMAYSQNIVVELINHFGLNKQKIIQYLKKYKPGISLNLDEYMTMFKNNSKTIKLLYRYMTDIINKDKNLNSK